jgi:hypothetical protein
MWRRRDWAQPLQKTIGGRRPDMPVVARVYVRTSIWLEDQSLRLARAENQCKPTEEKCRYVRVSTQLLPAPSAKSNSKGAQKKSTTTYNTQELSVRWTKKLQRTVQVLTGFRVCLLMASPPHGEGAHLRVTDATAGDPLLLNGSTCSFPFAFFSPTCSRDLT